jgi:CubicO group peptidase (beta-lactamase class C family)
MEMAPDRYRYVLERPVAEPPGTRWRYCGGATALLDRLIAAGTGKPLDAYGREVLFGPLGIDHFEWMAGADGVPSAASGLRMTPRDLARIGEVVLAGGGGIVPETWIRTMSEPRLPTEWGAKYGYHWYLDTVGGHEMISGIGNGGQRLIVLPGLGATAAIMAGNYDDPEQWRTPQTALERVILPSLT